MKPYEVEILVGEVNGEIEGTSIYHVLFDGSVTDEHGFVAIGGHADDLMESLKQRYETGWDLGTAVKTAVEVLRSPEAREIAADQIEAGALERSRTQRRKFRRLKDAEIAGFLDT
jgi:proteasome alpha subunit